jgi:hypothetical protein
MKDFFVGECSIAAPPTKILGLIQCDFCLVIFYLTPKRLTFTDMAGVMATHIYSSGWYQPGECDKTLKM